ncbi:insulin-like growth factor-binding protein-like 1 [Leptonychotes weddellii]|uniref:Insulin-like growth factor-binding protein-like 1 n=1 Tax=Leptonychotes weddellii TaxID=9713 RepID=A0A2U3XCI8_LEPWE|nr:insulin-like growth factor-binding protein-like 1 [Leptonychotes weddellii]
MPFTLATDPSWDLFHARHWLSIGMKTTWSLPLGSSHYEGTGLCVCAQRGAVCGSDGRSYPSICALRLRVRHAPRPHPGHLHKARDGPCEFAPLVVTPPRSVHNVPGTQVNLSCEVRAVPTPVVTWRKVTQSPEGTQVLEDLPGDHVNIAVQVQGGPSDHEATAWVLVGISFV